MVTKHRADLPVLCGCFPLAICFTFGSVYMSMPLSHFVPAYPSPSPCPQVHSLLLHLYSCPAPLLFTLKLCVCFTTLQTLLNSCNLRMHVLKMGEWRFGFILVWWWQCQSRWGIQEKMINFQENSHEREPHKRWRVSREQNLRAGSDLGNAAPGGWGVWERGPELMCFKYQRTG